MRPTAARVVPFVLAGVVFALDRVSKWQIQTYVKPWETRRVIPGLLNLVHAENPGIAFSMLADVDTVWRRVFLITMSVAVLLFISYLLLRRATASDWLLRIGLGCILGGALGNLYDRVAQGTVTDFVEVYSGSHYFPAFNVADSSITVGAACLLLDSWRGRKRNAAIEPERSET